MSTEPTLDECIEWIGTEEGVSAPNVWPCDAYYAAIEKLLLRLRALPREPAAYADLVSQLRAEVATFGGLESGEVMVRESTLNRAIAALPREQVVGIFGRTDLPEIMVYTAQLADDKNQGLLGWHQMVMFADHQRALDKVIAALSQSSEQAVGAHRDLVSKLQALYDGMFSQNPNRHAIAEAIAALSTNTSADTSRERAVCPRCMLTPEERAHPEHYYVPKCVCAPAAAPVAEEMER